LAAPGPEGLGGEAPRRDTAGAALAARGEASGPGGAGAGATAGGGAGTAARARAAASAAPSARGEEGGSGGAGTGGTAGGGAGTAAPSRAAASGEASPGSADASGVDYALYAAGIAALNSGPKRNKAVLGFERPEFLGAVAVEVAPAIAALLNACRRVHALGATWALSALIPIFKDKAGSNQLERGDYRGVAVGSLMGELYATLVHTRVYDCAAAAAP
jgi:hypothetical protein